MRALSTIGKGPLCLVILTLAGGCASRQAIVQSEPSRGSLSSGAASATRLRSELLNLADSEHSYQGREGRYADNLGALGFTPTSGVSLFIIQGDRSGFSAIASSASSECGIYSGSVRPPRGYLAAPDVVSCRP